VKKNNPKKIKKISPHEALKFLENMRRIVEDKDEPTKLISLRVPNNILQALKTKAKSENNKYQSLIIYYIRQGLKNNARNT
jgi:predicted DNA binding CopG/RHH family protein